MLNKNELLLVNEIVKGCDKESSVILKDSKIVIVDPICPDEIFDTRESFLNELIKVVELETKPTTFILRQKEAINHLNILDILLTGNKIKVTNNKFNDICKELASQYYNNFGLYDAYLDLYDIIPFEIKTNNEELKKLINFACRTEEQKDGYILYRGFTNNSNNADYIKNTFDMKFIYNDYYQKSMFNDNLMLIVEYTEGDLNFSLCDNKESYNKEKERTIKFYEENY